MSETLPTKTASLRKKDVLNVLKSLGLKNIENESGYIEVLNKIDLLDEAGRRYLEENAARNANVVPLSAVSGEGTGTFSAAGRRQAFSKLPHG